MSTRTLTPSEKLLMDKALKDISGSLIRIEAERELLKQIKEETCEELDLNKKVFERIARAFHKQNFPQEVELNNEFESLYASYQNKSV